MPIRRATTPGRCASGLREGQAHGGRLRLGTTVDQIAAKQIGRDSAIPRWSWALISSHKSAAATTAMRRLQNNLSWSSRHDAAADRSGSAWCVRAAVWRRRVTGRTRAELRQNASILDWVMGDVTAAEQWRSRRSKSANTDAIRKSAPHPARQTQTADSPMPRPRAAGQRARFVGRAREADVRPAGPRLSRRHHAHRHVPAGAGSQHSCYPQIGAEPHHPVSHHGNIRNCSREAARSRTTSRCSATSSNR